MIEEIFNSAKKLQESEFIDSNAFNNSHNPDKIIGVFWYAILDKVLDIVFENVSHNQREKFKKILELKPDPKSLLAGRVYNDEGDILLMIYDTDSYGKEIHLSIEVLSDLKNRVNLAIENEVHYVIDVYGKLLESNKSAK